MRDKTRITADSVINFSVTELAYGTWIMTFSCNGIQFASISYRYEENLLTLSFSNNGKPVLQRIYFEFTPCHFGGQRRWFCCPQCGQRCGKLYGRFKLFVCRKCAQVDYYRSQSVGRHQRFVSRLCKLSSRLGGPTSGSNIYSQPSKPKGMHWKTYWRLLDKKNRYAKAALGFTSVAVARLMRKAS